MAKIEVKPVKVQVQSDYFKEPVLKPKRLHYYFEDVEQCEMCGDSTDHHQLLGQRLNKSQGLNPKNKVGITVSVLKCTNCGLIYCSPQPIPADIQDHYGVPPEDYWNDDYFIWSEDYFKREIQITKELINFREGMLALDIGAGIGKGMLSLNHAGFDTYGIEPSEPFYQRAISKMKIDPKDLKLGKVEDVDYPENTFDFITFGAVFEHLYHPVECLKRAMQWLKPGGLVHIEVPSARFFMSKLINTYFSFKGTNYVTHLSPMHSPYHLYEFDIKSFEKLGEKLNFSVTRSMYDVCTIYHVPLVLQPILRKYMEKTHTGMQLTVWLRKAD